MIYVDDTIVTRSCATEIGEVISHLNHQFSLKDLGLTQFFLGMKITQLHKGVLLSQKKYISDLLHRLSMDNASSVLTPMVVTPKLTATDGHSFTDVHLYRQAVGALQYICFARPDITYIVNKVSQFMNSSQDIHWKAAKRILRYLKGTITHGLYFYTSGVISLECFVDAGWASCCED